MDHKELPSTIIIEKIPDYIYDYINTYCADKFGKCAENYNIKIEITDINWE